MSGTMNALGLAATMDQTPTLLVPGWASLHPWGLDMELTEDQRRRHRMAVRLYRHRHPDRARAQKERYLGRPIPRRGTMQERFWAKVRKGDGCWEWTGARVYPGGYGQFVVDSRRIRSHRVSWEIHNGPVPAGLWVLHRCDNPPCVRPDHLFVGTRQDNVDDAVAKGRMYFQRFPERAARDLHLGRLRAIQNRSA